MMRYGLDLAAVEFLDRRSIAALNRYRGFGLEEQPSLFLEVHGTPSALDEVFASAQALCVEQAGALSSCPMDVILEKCATSPPGRLRR